eukprot:scaffold267919_cov23-Prasinocladus_malaysianus.AAC.2
MGRLDGCVRVVILCCPGCRKASRGQVQPFQLGKQADSPIAFRSPVAIFPQPSIYMGQTKREKERRNPSKAHKITRIKTPAGFNRTVA